MNLLIITAELKNLKMKKVKFGVIGLGHIGIRHAEMIQRNHSCQLIALSDILPKQDLGLESFNIPF